MKFESLKEREEREKAATTSQTETLEESRVWAEEILAKIEKEENSLPNNEKDIADIETSVTLADSSKTETIKNDLNIEENLTSLNKEQESAFARAKVKLNEFLHSETFSDIAEVTPFVAGAKKIGEGAYGETLTGEELSNWEHIKYVSKGSADLAMDAEGGGEIKKGEEAVFLAKKMIKKAEQNPEQ